jgi:hypothetical protein
VTNVAANGDECHDDVDGLEERALEKVVFPERTPDLAST